MPRRISGDPVGKVWRFNQEPSARPRLAPITWVTVAVRAVEPNSHADLTCISSSWGGACPSPRLAHLPRDGQVMQTGPQMELSAASEPVVVGHGATDNR